MLLLIVIIASFGYLQVNQELSTLRTSYTSLQSQYSDLQTRYTQLGESYSGLQVEYNRLQRSYSALLTNYSSLQEAQQSLITSYSELSQSYTIETTLRIGTSLETYYDYVRANVVDLGSEPLGEERWYLQPSYYNLSVSFAAIEAAHDAGNAYWPGMETGCDYYNIASEHAYTTASNIIANAIVFSGINYTDSSVDRIDKILKIIHSLVTYQHRFVDHMWFPTETLTFRSGDCTSFSILAACMFERVGIKSAIGFFKDAQGEHHAMVLVRLDGLGQYGYDYYWDLRAYGLSPGKWIIIEPQCSSLSEYSNDLDWVTTWSLIAASEVPYGA